MPQKLNSVKNRPVLKCFAKNTPIIYVKGPHMTCPAKVKLC